MTRIRLFALMLIPLICVSCQTVSLKPTEFFPDVEFSDEKFDPVHGILSLNYITFSVYRITSYNDRVVLEEECDKMLNNLALRKIPDEDIIDSYQNLFRLLKDFRLSESQRTRLESKYEQKIKNAIYESLPSPSTFLATPNPYMIAAIALQQAGSAFMNYQQKIKQYQEELEEETWKLDADAFVQLMEFRAEFLKYSWKVLTTYNMPDKYRVTESGFQDLIEALKDSDAARKFRRLSEMKRAYEAFPPFWYYLGEAAEQAGLLEEAWANYARYEEVEKGLWRKDPYLASTCMSRLALMQTHRELGPRLPAQRRAEIRRTLRLLEDNAQMSDWGKLAFATIFYMEIHDNDEAMRVAQKNLDEMTFAAEIGNDFVKDESSIRKSSKVQKVLDPDLLSMGRRLRGEALSRGNVKKFTTYIQKLKDDNTANNFDILYLIGRMTTTQYLNEFREEIEAIRIECDYNAMRTDHLKVWLPTRWLLSATDIVLTAGNQDLPMEGPEGDEDGGEVYYYCDYEIDGFERVPNQLLTVSIEKPDAQLSLVYLINAHTDGPIDILLSEVVCFGKRFILSGGKFKRVKS